MNFYIFGGNEQSSHKFVSEQLGKETIDTNTYGKSTGHSGSYSTNYQIAGRELMTPDEVRALPDEYAILFIRGEKAIKDKKYNTFKHHNFKYTEDGGYEPYQHGQVNNSVASLFIAENKEEIQNIQEIKINNLKDYDILIDDEVDEFLLENKQ